jgi:iron(III) transport system ATP-binding protein
MTKTTILTLDSVSKQFSSHRNFALKNVSLNLEKGEIIGLLGPSGCGKTTLLRIIAGFEQVDTGKVILGGKVVNDTHFSLAPELRNTGMVFQDYALFPHLTIAENIAFGLTVKGKNYQHQEIKDRVAQVLMLVGLTGLEKRYPHELSGGQQQRIALARALAPQPELILLDEPLSNLDVQVRERLRYEIRSILKASGISALFVTHDQEEAMAICDKIAVMQCGNLEQIGTPEAIYTQPASRFVAEFVTHANFLPATRQGKFWQTEIGAIAYASVDYDNFDNGELMLREEELLLNPDDNAPIVVRDRQFLGREYRYCLQTPSGKRLHARTTVNTPIEIGTKVKLSCATLTPQIFPEQKEDHLVALR